MPGHGGPHGGGPHGGGHHGGGYHGGGHHGGGYHGGGYHGGGHGHMPPPRRHFGMGHRPYRRGCMGCMPGCLMPILAVIGIIVLALVLIF